ncbi:MAG: NAD(P) transhydrogenase subunit alpha [Flavobacteriales bacterium]|nr:NAD(P) transhydrogenase subunit alpha [Flavobacteriales bacterium]
MELIIEFLSENLGIITILVLASFLGMEIIGKVPTVLHTPLMSGANAISGVVVIGAIILIRRAEATDYMTLALGFVGISLAMINVVGGFAVTNRMLEMFKKKNKK